ncbi:MAG: putative Ig domain-containing protein, partial [Actinomycetales bacterium]
MSSALRSPLAALMSALVAILAVSITALPAAAATFTSATYTIDTSSPTYDRLATQCIPGGPTSYYQVIEFETVQDVVEPNVIDITVNTTDDAFATLYWGSFDPTMADSNCWSFIESIAAPSGTFSSTYSDGGTQHWYLVITHDSPATGVDVSATITTSAGSVNSVPAPPTITLDPATAPNGTVGTAYSQAFTASGGTGPYTFAVSAGTLPAGLSLSASGVLSGTPTTAGTSNFTIQATDADLYQGVMSYSLVIDPAPVSITTTTLAPGTAATPYSATIEALGGTAPYTFAVTTGSLPAGTSLTSAGLLSGTPTAAGAFTFTVTATDSTSGTALTDTQELTLTVALPTVTLDPAQPSTGQINSAYSHSFTASGGTAPYAIEQLMGTLPSGLTLNSNGTVSGTPTQSGVFSFSLRASDSTTGTGPATGDASYTLTIAGPDLTITPDTLPEATAGTAYSQTLSSDSGTAPYTFAVTGGSLPAGLSLTSDGTLAGTPTAAGSFPFTVTATDSTLNVGGTGQMAYTLVVALPMVTLSTDPLPAGTAGAPYSATLTASGGVPDYTFDLATGTLPAGLTLNPDGTLTGTPTESGTSTFTVTATDSTTGTGPATGTREYTITVASSCQSNNEEIAAGQFRASSSATPLGLPYVLVMQFDGNAVVYAPDFKPIWDTHTAGNPGARLVMQGDGNLVVYSTQDRALWSSRTGTGCSQLVMQADGNLVIYTPDTPAQAVWSSGVDHLVG